MNTLEQFTDTVQGVVSLCSRVRLHGQTYFRTWDLSLTSTGLRADGWLWRYLTQMSRDSTLTPLHASLVRSLKLALEAASSVKAWRTLDSNEAEKVTKNLVWHAFTDIEEALLNQPSGKHEASNMSAELRKFTLRAVELKHPGIAQIVRASFKSRLSFKRPPRPLISQLPGLDENQRPRNPLDVLAHTSLKDLRRKQYSLLKSDLAKVESACEAEILSHHSFLRRLEAALSLPVTDQEIELVGGATLWSNKEESNQWFDGVAPDPLHLGSIYMQLIKRQLQESRSVVRLYFNRIRLIRSRLIDLGVLDRQFVDNPFRVYLFGDAGVRVACTLSLQAHTGWNCSTVMSLTTDRVIGDKPPYTIQGYKSKTNSDAPVSIIEASDIVACQAIEFLINRLSALKRMNIVQKGESRLWINPRNVGSTSGRVITYVGYSGDLKAFQAKYGLPAFSPDQVRAQVLAIRGDLGYVIEEARQTAGHAIVDTTARYLHQELLMSIGSAINVQFQRRLEQSTAYERGLNGREEDRDISASLFYPIGDGSSCKDVKKPPQVSYLKDGVCDGQNCHAGDGCDNRVIILNKTRVMENWKQIQFYMRNWKDLLAGYPDQFRKVHLPSMIFAMTLGDVISNGPLGVYQRVLARNTEAGK